MKRSSLNQLRNSDLFSRIPQMNYLPRWGVLLMDVVLCTLAFWLSVWICNGFLFALHLDKQIIPIGVQYLIVMAVHSTGDKLLGVPHVFGNTPLLHVHRHDQSAAVQCHRRLGIDGV